MTYFSHSKVNADGKVQGSKILKNHIQGVLNKALYHHSTNLDLGIPDNEFKNLLRIVVHFHDLGKYTSYFQNYL
jgi:CRISPR-associated endonuclease/helicase Cas3